MDREGLAGFAANTRWPRWSATSAVSGSSRPKTLLAAPRGSDCVGDEITDGCSIRLCGLARCLRPGGVLTFTGIGKWT